MPARAGRGGARLRAACMALLGDLIGVSGRVVDAILGLAGFVGDWMGGSGWGVLRRAVGRAIVCRA